MKELSNLTLNIIHEATMVEKPNNILSIYKDAFRGAHDDGYVAGVSDDPNRPWFGYNKHTARRTGIQASTYGLGAAALGAGVGAALGQDVANSAALAGLGGAAVGALKGGVIDPIISYNKGKFKGEEARVKNQAQAQVVKNIVKEG